VWGKLAAGLAGIDLPHPSEKALRDLRRRLGPGPLRALFEVVAGPQSGIAQIARRALSAGGPLRWRGAYWRCMSALAGRTMACLAKEREGRAVVVFGAVVTVIGLATFAYLWWARWTGLRAQGVAKRRDGEEVPAVLRRGASANAAVLCQRS
jgi:hypothetical protein